MKTHKKIPTNKYQWQPAFSHQLGLEQNSHLALNAARVLCKDTQNFLAIVDHCMFLTQHLPTKQDLSTEQID
jgi:hypothetical protein